MSVRISVITPSFNQAKYLDETVRSVVSQREHIHEYFILDGGSTDGSADVIRKYADKIDWWVSEKDKGQSDAIHRGFQRATGDYLFWINSDDLILPGALDAVQSALTAHPEWDILTGYHVRIDGESKITSYHSTPPESHTQFAHGISRVCQQTCFFRRSLYERVGGLNLELHCVMDTELWHRMDRAGAQWGHIPAYLGAYRWHEEAKMIGTKYAQLREQERQWLEGAYPERVCAGAADELRMFWYRAAQVLSGRRLAAAIRTSANRGKYVSDVFPPR